MSSNEHLNNVQQYYVLSAPAYQSWGKDEERRGVYALHSGFEKTGEQISHHESVKALTRELVGFANIQPDNFVLDAGCGTGAIAYETKTIHPSAHVFGINIAANQLQQAQEFQNGESPKQSLVNFSLQDYEQTGFAPNSFDAVIFSESLAHAENRAIVLNEISRILRPGGSVTIGEILQLRPVANEEEKELRLELATGWVSPGIANITDLHQELSSSGFTLSNERIVTPFVLPSTRRMRKDAEQKFMQGQITPMVEVSGKAAIALNKTMESGLIGYVFLHAKKTET